MSTIAIAVDAARDAAKRASDGMRELVDLVEARLLVRDNDKLDADGKTNFYVEPAHDALVLAWDKAKNEVIQRTVNARMREQS